MNIISYTTELSKETSQNKGRNSLIEIYRLIFCFWVMHHHDFFFIENDGKSFSGALLAVDFFFILSGFFLLNAMRRLKEGNAVANMWDLVFSKIKPLFFSLCFNTAFIGVCILLFVRENYFDVLFYIFRYWWYLLYMSVAVGIFYLLYRGIKNEKLYAICLAILAIAMGVFHYALETQGFFIYEFTFAARTFGLLSVGMLLSYVPAFKTKVFNLSILFVIILIPTLFYLAYIEKDYWMRLLMIPLFAALIYFTSNISLKISIFDYLGQLGPRLYVYMAFASMLSILGLSHHRILFVIEVAIATMDLVLSTYIKKYTKLKRQIQDGATA